MSADAVRDSLERDPRDSQDAGIIVIRGGRRTQTTRSTPYVSFWAIFTISASTGTAGGLRCAATAGPR